MKVRISPRALADLRRLQQFLSDRNDLAARRAIATVNAAIVSLSDFPFRAKQITGTAHRRHIVAFGQAAYLIDYRVDEREDTLIVLRIRHSREMR